MILVLALALNTTPTAAILDEMEAQGVQCLSIYSDVGAPVRGDPLPDVEGERLALTADLETGEVNTFVNVADLQALLQNLPTLDGTKGNGVWHDVEVEYPPGSGNWRQTKSCLVGCFICDCCVVYVPRGWARPQVQLPAEVLEALGARPEVGHFTLYQVVDTPTTWTEEGEPLLNDDGFLDAVVSAEWDGEVWDATILDPQAFQEAVERAHSKGDCCDPLDSMNGLWSRCRKELCCGLYQYFHCCAAVPCDYWCDCSMYSTWGTWGF